MSLLRVKIRSDGDVLEALEDARLVMRGAGLALGLQDELATVIRLIHGRLGFDEGGLL